MKFKKIAFSAREARNSLAYRVCSDKPTYYYVLDILTQLVQLYFKLHLK